MILIDGARGEGGGQVLRTSLSLSLATGEPFRIERIRAGRAKPGLLRQHLAAVRAAATLSEAEVEGAALGAETLVFRPRRLRGGRFPFAVGSAGSTTLVLQTVLPALFGAPEPAELTLEGGTHNPLAPPWEMITRSFLPVLEGLGARVAHALEARGFAPRGGGRARVTVEPARLAPLELLERGRLLSRGASVLAVGLPAHVAERERERLALGLGCAPREVALDASVPATGVGNVVLAWARYERVTEVIASFGERGLRAEAVADRATDALNAYLRGVAPVGEHLADQLVVPLALGAGGAFRTGPPSGHLRTQVDTVAAFLGPAVSLEPVGPEVFEVRVAPFAGSR